MWFILAAMSGDSAAETLRNYIARDYMTDAQVAEAAGGVVLEAER